MNLEVSKVPEQPSYRTTALTRQELHQMAQFMCGGSAVLLDHAEFDPVLFGSGDTGVITMQSDITLSALYINEAVRRGRFAFSEESDPKDASGNLERVKHARIWQFDPVDGSGDRKKGTPGSPSGDGYTSLASFIEQGSPIAGVCVRPAHRELWVFERQGITLRQLSEDYRQLIDASFQRKERSEGDNIIRVNIRPAYPETNFPDRLLDIATERSGGKFKFVWAEAGGAGDCFCRLIRGDLDIVTSGRKTDWKTWDTHPFGVAIRGLNGELTDYSGDSIQDKSVYDNDLWHTGGVLASVGVPEAFKIFQETLEALQANESQHSDGKPMVYDPRVRK